MMQTTCIMRTSAYRGQIIALLEKRHFLTIAEIHEAIPRADYSTIFRNVEQLLSDRKIRRVAVGGRSAAYESADESHDHFICNDCGKVEEIHVSRASIRGKKVDDVTVRGSCDECRK